VSIDMRHVDIEKDDVGLILVDRFFAVACLAHDTVLAFGEQHAQYAARHPVVIGNDEVEMEERVLGKSILSRRER
jgi:hypothetical protein